MKRSRFYHMMNFKIIKKTIDKNIIKGILLLKDNRCFANLIRKSVKIRYSPHYCETDESVMTTEIDGILGRK